MVVDSPRLELLQLENGYCYNSDSLFLYSLIHAVLGERLNKRQFAKKQNNKIKILDIGAGSGILGLLCARDLRVYGVEVDLILSEINETMAKIAAKNALNNGIKCEILCGNILESLTKSVNFTQKFNTDSTQDSVIKSTTNAESSTQRAESKITESTTESNAQNTQTTSQTMKFDFIISNPPFYPSHSLNPKKQHLFLAKKSENLPLDGLFSVAKKSLKPNGKFIFCYDAKEIQSVFSHITKYNFNCEVLQFVYPKESKAANLAMFVCGISKQQIKILPSIFNFINGEHSPQAREIFKLCNTFSIKIKESDL